MPDFLPRRDVELLSWTRTLASRLVAAPEVYQVTPESAADYAAIVQRFADAYLSTVLPGSDTSVATRVKNDVRRVLARETRSIAACIRVSPAISVADKFLVGLVARAAPTRIRRPTSRPIVDVINVRGFRVTLGLRDTDSPMRRRIPPDVTCAVLFWCAGERYPENIREWKLLRSTSSARLTVELPTEKEAGTRVWVCARWANARAEHGPLSETRDIHAAIRSPRYGSRDTAIATAA